MREYLPPPQTLSQSDERIIESSKRNRGVRTVSNGTNRKPVDRKALAKTLQKLKRIGGQIHVYTPKIKLQKRRLKLSKHQENVFLNEGYLNKPETKKPLLSWR